jgi:hypothetical protein
MVNYLELTYLEALYLADLNEQREVILARRYHEGDQDVYLTDRAKEFLGLHNSENGKTADNPFKLNICRSVVIAVLDELEVIGFTTNESSATKPVADWAWKLWQTARLDAVQKDLHEAALRDREAFLIVDWDNTQKRPRFTWHPRYTSTQADDDGDDMGCWAIYPDNDDTQPMTAAVHQWVEIRDVGGQPVSRQRRTIYYPDRIERYFYFGGWQKFTENGQPWPIPWKDAVGNPLGIPMAHFKNSGLRPEAWDAIPMQDAINKTLIDILATGDTTAFRIFAAFGWMPTSDGRPPASDGSNRLELVPGAVVGSTSPTATLNAIEGADVTPMVNTLSQLILYTAMITDTPASRFQATGAVQSGETLKQTEKPLKKKAKTRRVRFGDAWEDAFGVARKLQNLYGSEKLDENALLQTLWETSETLDDLTLKKALGVPQERIWQEMGYSQSEIDAMKSMDDYKAKVDLMRGGFGSTNGA